MAKKKEKIVWNGFEQFRQFLVPLDQLKEDPQNARKHSDRNVMVIKTSLNDLGQHRLGIILEDGTFQIGSGMLRAAQDLGWTHLAVVKSGDSGAIARIRALTDNRSGDSEIGSEWDFLKLADDLLELDTGEFDLEKIGWTDEEVKEIMTWTPPGAEPPEEPPLPEPPKEPHSKVGDLWLLGDHRVLCGDSTKKEDVERIMDGKKAVWMWTDPPYGVKYVGKQKSAMTIQNDSPVDLGLLLTDAFSLADSILEEGSPIYIAHPAGVLSLQFGNAFLSVGWKFHETLVWIKNSMVLGHSDYHYKHEPIIYGWKGKNRKWYGDRSQVSVFEVDRPSRSDNHPTMKPPDLILPHLENSSQSGDIGYEPFAGSGTTVVAADHLNRICYAMELEPQYVDVICQRYYNLTKKIPVHAETGEKFPVEASDE